MGAVPSPGLGVCVCKKTVSAEKTVFNPTVNSMIQIAYQSTQLAELSSMALLVFVELLIQPNSELFPDTRKSDDREINIFLLGPDFEL